MAVEEVRVLVQVVVGGGVYVDEHEESVVTQGARREGQAWVQ